MYALKASTVKLFYRRQHQYPPGLYSYSRCCNSLTEL